MSALEERVDADPDEEIDSPIPLDQQGAVQRVGTNVRQIRERQGMTARALCQLAKISPMQLWRIEQLVAQPSEAKIRQLAAALGVSIGTLFGEEQAASNLSLQRALATSTLTRKRAQVAKFIKDIDLLLTTRAQMTDTLRDIDAALAEEPTSSDCITLALQGSDRIGMLRDVAHAISSENVSIEHCFATIGQDTQAQILIRLGSATDEQLEKIMDRIEHLQEKGQITATLGPAQASIEDTIKNMGAECAIVHGPNVDNVVDGFEKRLALRSAEKKADELRESGEAFTYSGTSRQAS